MDRYSKRFVCFRYCWFSVLERKDRCTYPSTRFDVLKKGLIVYMPLTFTKTRRLVYFGAMEWHQKFKMNWFPFFQKFERTAGIWAGLAAQRRKLDLDGLCQFLVSTSPTFISRPFVRFTTVIRCGNSVSGEYQIQMGRSIRTGCGDSARPRLLRSS